MMFYEQLELNVQNLDIRLIMSHHIKAAGKAFLE